MTSSAILQDARRAIHERLRALAYERLDIDDEVDHAIGDADFAGEDSSLDLLPDDLGDDSDLGDRYRAQVAAFEALRAETVEALGEAVLQLRLPYLSTHGATREALNLPSLDVLKRGGPDAQEARHDICFGIGQIDFARVEAGLDDEEPFSAEKAGIAFQADFDNGIDTLNEGLAAARIELEGFGVGL